MKRFGLLAWVLGTMAFGACGGGDMGKVKGFLDECKACADKACLEALEKKMEPFEAEMKAKYKGEGKEKPADDLMAAGRALGDCMDEQGEKFSK